MRVWESLEPEPANFEKWNVSWESNWGKTLCPWFLDPTITNNLFFQAETNSETLELFGEK
jgi:hypothetical protein